MHSLKKSFVLRFITVGFKQAVILLTSFIAALILPIPEYAQFSYLLAVYSIAYMLADFGISTAATRFVANNPTKENTERITGAGLIIALVSVILGVLVISILLFLGLLSIVNPLHLVALLVMVAFSVIATLFEGVLRGLEKYNESAVVTVVSSLIAIFVTYFLLKQYGILGGLLAQTFYWVFMTVGLFYLGKIRPNFAVTLKYVKPLLKFSVQFGIAAISYFLFSRYVLIVLGNVGATNELATFELLSRVMLLFAFPFSIVGQILAPRYAKEEIVKNKSFLRNELGKFSIWLLPVAIICVGLFYGLILVLPVVFPQYNELLANKTVVYSMLAQLAIYIWTNLVDTGIIVPAGYAKILSYSYVPLGLISLFALPLAYAYGGVSAIFVAVVVLQLIMALSVRIWVYLLLRASK